MDLVQIIDDTKDEFLELASTHSAVTFAQECLFAKEALQNNSFLASIAKQNPESLKNAIRNVAAAGITLNPVHARAYLVPREGRVCLDVSYKGILFVASDSGAVAWVQAQAVFEKDEFVMRGVGEKPLHETKPFGDRGAAVGFYCVAKLKSDDFLTHAMSKEQVDAIMERSQAYKSYKAGKAKSCPWVTDYEEMAKKTVIKQAAKLWPKTDAGMRLDHAIQSENASNGIDFIDEQKAIEIAPEQMPAAISERKDKLLEELGAVFKDKTKDATTLDEKGAFLIQHLKVKSWSLLKTKEEKDLIYALEQLKQVAPLKKKIVSASDVKFSLD